MENHLNGNWGNLESSKNYSYICGFCGAVAGPAYRYCCKYTTSDGKSHTNGNIYLCPTCNKPTFIINNFGLEIEQVPGPIIGENIEFLPDEVGQLYDEARKCISVNAFTSSVLACRKLLMNISVSKGAEPGKSFASYVSYLEDNHFTPPGSREWVDHIRKKGNEATHEITSMSKEDAIELLEFTEMLLRFVYEMPGRMTKHIQIK